MCLLILLCAVVLSGSDINRSFRGFLIQGRIVADSSTTAGMFIDNGSGDQQVTCDVSTSIITSYIAYNYGPSYSYIYILAIATDTV